MVFKEEFQAEDFRTAVKKIPNAHRKRKIVEESPIIIIPDTCVELQEIVRESYNGDYLLVEEEQYERITGDQDPSPDYDPKSYTSAISITEATRLRLLEREDSMNLYLQKPEKCHIVRRVDDPANINNPNNIVFMSRLLHQHFDVIDSTEDIPTFYFQYISHNNNNPTQGIVGNWPLPVYETTLWVVFKHERSKIGSCFIVQKPENVNQTTIQLKAHFPQPEAFKYFSEIKAEETLAQWKSYDGLLDF